MARLHHNSTTLPSKADILLNHHNIRELRSARMSSWSCCTNRRLAKTTAYARLCAIPTTAIWLRSAPTTTAPVQRLSAVTSTTARLWPPCSSTERLKHLSEWRLRPRCTAAPAHSDTIIRPWRAWRLHFPVLELYRSEEGTPDRHQLFRPERTVEGVY